MTARIAKTLTVLALGWLIIVMTTPAAGAQDVGLPIGSQAPAVVLEDLAGEPFDLAQYIGQRPLLIEFWASWCSVCEALAPRLRQAHERFGAEVDFLVVAVAVNQSKRRVQRHLEEHDTPYRFLWDGQGRATRAYKVPTTAHVVVVDSEGKISYTGVGADQDLESALAALQGT
jgi:peroxiredoxin